MIKHLAVVMDGNRRWAKKNGLESFLGHYHGALAAQKAINFCLDNGISYLSLYSFSLENFKRTEEEKNYIFNLIVQESEKNLDETIKKGIRVRFIGDQNRFPDVVVSSCKKIEEKTAHLTTLNLNLLFCYGARQEIISCVKHVVDEVVAGKITQNEISEDIFSKFLWTNGTPEPDLIIRTGGQQRLSNFLLYQAAYSELYFLDLLWPEVEMDHFAHALTQFKERRRNFGV